MKIKKVNRLQIEGRKTINYSAIYQNEMGSELQVHFCYSKKTNAVIPTEVLLDKVKYGCKLRRAMNESGIEVKTVDFLNETKSVIDKHYLKKSKNMKKAKNLKKII